MHFSNSAQANSQQCQPGVGSLWRSRSNSSFASFHLGIATITNLEPCASLPISDVRPEAVLGYYALQIHFADTLQQCPTALQGGQRIVAEMRQEAGQKVPQFMLSIL